MITTRAKRGGQCPLCHEPWEVGDRIARLKVPVKVHGWYDYGKMKGEQWESYAWWAHPACVEKHEVENEE
ncbi:hypothetical protein LCGC14_1692470 [marine sediment metagenome]|uniref:Uncharacterized protein n=1 Tax=marine sediment metagenome TaxID=412755 RepID=A0A0F9KKG5_9ZZZZ